MPGELFTIAERPDIGGFVPRGGAVRFEWTNTGRSSPHGSWPGGITQRKERTDYPGADNPTIQVLGPNFKPFTLNGRWMDKHNSPGFARDTFKAFKALVRRGNVVEVSYSEETYFGIIEEFDWDYQAPWNIGYSFTVDPLREPGSDELAQPPSPVTVKDANTLSREIEEIIQTDMVAVDEIKPAIKLADAISPTATEQFDDLKSSSEDFNTIVDQRVLAVASDAFINVKRAVSMGDVLIGKAQVMLDDLNALRSDTALIYQDAMGVLDFEVWASGLAEHSRLVVVGTYEARQQLDEQAEPNAIALYRPFKNESLYSISNRFYGTPHNAMLIKDRNRLDSSNLLGTELLIIPEAPAQ